MILKMPSPILGAAFLFLLDAIGWRLFLRIRLALHKEKI
jgi:hypothetical protein